MKISEMVNFLEQIKEKEGDIEVVVWIEDELIPGNELLCPVKKITTVIHDNGDEGKFLELLNDNEEENINEDK